jgi:hypothetical protein
MGWDGESVDSEIEVLLWGERKRSEVCVYHIWREKHGR